MEIWDSFWSFKTNQPILQNPPKILYGGTYEEPLASMGMSCFLDPSRDKFKEEFSILDYGCGAGILGNFISERLSNFKYYGLEPNSPHGVERITLGKNYLNDERLFFGLIDKDLEYCLNQKIDSIILISVFTHLVINDITNILDNLIKVFDKNPNISKNTLEETLLQDFVFISVPTPMRDAMGADCNLSIIESCFDEIDSIGSKAIFIIKSTIPIGTTKSLQSKHSNLNIVHSPEFLTAKFAKEDFLNADRHIVGYTKKKSAGNKVIQLFNKAFPNIQTILMKSDESESVKYIANCFFATKVSFFNEIYTLIESLGLDWHSIINGVMSDRRIGQSHFQVPGHDGDKGFGGTCFPKDINALIKTFEKNGLDPKLLKSAWDVNLDVRSDLDWSRSESAVKE